MRKLQFDVPDAAASIRQRSAGQTFADYAADRWFRRAVEREFEIIGEALKRLARTVPVVAAGITAARRILESHLPRLREEIESLSREAGGEP